ncbi:MAG: lipoprotein [Granulosicoccus sp.]
MSKWFITLPSVLIGSSILLGCGNKGDLFLPPDPRLAEELEAASERINEYGAELTNEEQPDKKKRDPEQPSQ